MSEDQSPILAKRKPVPTFRCPLNIPRSNDECQVVFKRGLGMEQSFLWHAFVHHKITFETGEDSFMQCMSFMITENTEIGREDLPLPCYVSIFGLDIIICVGMKNSTSCALNGSLYFWMYLVGNRRGAIDENFAFLTIKNPVSGKLLDWVGRPQSCFHSPEFVMNSGKCLEVTRESVSQIMQYNKIRQRTEWLLEVSVKPARHFIPDKTLTTVVVADNQHNLSNGVKQSSLSHEREDKTTTPLNVKASNQKNKLCDYSSDDSSSIVVLDEPSQPKSKQFLENNYTASITQIQEHLISTKRAQFLNGNGKSVAGEKSQYDSNPSDHAGTKRKNNDKSASASPCRNRRSSSNESSAHSKKNCEPGRSKHSRSHSPRRRRRNRSSSTSRSSSNSSKDRKRSNRRKSRSRRRLRSPPSSNDSSSSGRGRNKFSRSRSTERHRRTRSGSTRRRLTRGRSNGRGKRNRGHGPGYWRSKKTHRSTGKYKSSGERVYLGKYRKSRSRSRSRNRSRSSSRSRSRSSSSSLHRKRRRSVSK